MEKTRASYNSSAIEILAKQYGFSTNYIYKCLRGDRVGTQPDRLIKEYPRIVAEIEKKIEELVKSNLENI